MKEASAGEFIRKCALDYQCESRGRCCADCERWEKCVKYCMNDPLKCGKLVTAPKSAGRRANTPA